MLFLLGIYDDEIYTPWDCEITLLPLVRWRILGVTNPYSATLMTKGKP